MRDFAHKGCDGWAIYESRYIEGDQPHNIHVVEARVIPNQDGTFSSRPNNERETQCGNQKLIDGHRSCILASKNPVDIRNKLAELQNSGGEVCGQCVATFYADDERE